MNFSKLSKLFLIAGAVLALASCKKDEETTEVKPYLSGSLSFKIDPFILSGSRQTMTPTGLSNPSGKGIGYYWRISPVMTTADTTRLENGLSPEGKDSDGSFTYQFKDSLATYTISCNAFAADYSSSYASTVVTTVKPGLDGSITGSGIQKNDPNKITVSGIDYYYTEHNGLKWMRNNLANPAYGVPYENCEAMSNVLGRFYSYEEAKVACPEGWRLPTDQEWRELGAVLNGKQPGEAVGAYKDITDVASKLMGDVQFNSSNMWDYWPKVGDITNSSKLALIPAGFVNMGAAEAGKGYPNATFTGVNEYAVFWTADEAGNDMAYYRYIYCQYPEMVVTRGDRETFGASVRCVK